MSGREPFNPLQAQEVAEAFNAAGVDYLFIGKSGAILLGYPGTTQDVDVFPAKSIVNGERMISALLAIGFALSAETQDEIVRGKDFVQLKNGPFDLDLIFAPDGIERFDVAWRRRIDVEGFPVCHLDDIIASKEATGRAKDRESLPRLRSFRDYWRRQVDRS